MYRAPPSQELCTWSSYEIAWLANLSPLCINHTLTSTDTRTETFWSALSATHESQIYFRSNPVRAILKLVKISYTFVALPSLERVKSIFNLCIERRPVKNYVPEALMKSLGLQTCPHYASIIPSLQLIQELKPSDQHYQPHTNPKYIFDQTLYAQF